MKVLKSIKTHDQARKSQRLMGLIDDVAALCLLSEELKYAKVELGEARASLSRNTQGNTNQIKVNSGLA